MIEYLGSGPCPICKEKQTFHWREEGGNAPHAVIHCKKCGNHTLLRTSWEEWTGVELTKEQQ